MDRFASEGVCDLEDGFSIHGLSIANSFGNRQANKDTLRQFIWPGDYGSMKDKLRPYEDIAERIKWHRSTIGLNQNDYAESIGVKRSAFSLWEAGTHRLSLDGALSLRSKYGLSLDFMYEGIDDALPMTLRNAWRERP